MKVRIAGRVLLAVALLLLCSAPAKPQSCDPVVLDNAGVLNGGEVAASAVGLLNQGADVHIVTVAHTQNLDVDEKAMEKSCVSWQSASGGRKNTLLVLMVAPKDHKLGIYYGGAWHNALDSRWNAIKSDYMAPRFRDGDFTGGMIAAETQLTQRIIASKDEAQHPILAQTTNVVQPTDYAGLWKFLMWSLIILTGLLIAYALYRVSTRRKRERESTEAAQQDAVLQKNNVADYLPKVTQLCNEQIAISQSTRAHMALTMVNSVSEEFARLSSNVITDPSQNGLTLDSYEHLATAYRGLYVRLANVETFLKGGETPAEPPKQKTPAPEESKATTSSDEPARTSEYTRSETSVVPVPIPIPYEEPERETYREPVESHRSSDDDDDSSSGGGSSSWGGDLGGGGGGDFGGGDSGGGGSSSF